ncbi:MAG: hypothetical protein U5K31_05330 [Balneolaceae bacterium]|nr:hypothetical protein [Balneolaceae bacterium]
MPWTPTCATLPTRGRRSVTGRSPRTCTSAIEQELSIISEMDFPGYFLIVQDFTTEARRRGVFVGPGRGSAAGSVVAYCLGIINIDPMEYDLLFERFLNPERVSPPDIDIDFDDTGRQEVIDYVVEEYGRCNVAQIVTYGTMKAKTAIRDVGRRAGGAAAGGEPHRQALPRPPRVDTFDKVLDKSENPETAEQIAGLFEAPDPQVAKMMRYARTLEGSVRQSGIHAAGVIIAPVEMTSTCRWPCRRTRSLSPSTTGPTPRCAGS